MWVAKYLNSLVGVTVILDIFHDQKQNRKPLLLDQKHMNFSQQQTGMDSSRIFSVAWRQETYIFSGTPQLILLLQGLSSLGQIKTFLLQNQIRFD